MSFCPTNRPKPKDIQFTIRKATNNLIWEVLTRECLTFFTSLAWKVIETINSLLKSTNSFSSIWEYASWGTKPVLLLKQPMNYLHADSVTIRGRRFTLGNRVCLKIPWLVFKSFTLRLLPSHIQTRVIKFHTSFTRIHPSYMLLRLTKKKKKILNGLWAVVILSHIIMAVLYFIRVELCFHFEWLNKTLRTIEKDTLVRSPPHLDWGFSFIPLSLIVWLF